MRKDISQVPQEGSKLDKSRDKSRDKSNDKVRDKSRDKSQDKNESKQIKRNTKLILHEEAALNTKPDNLSPFEVESASKEEMNQISNQIISPVNSAKSVSVMARFRPLNEKELSVSTDLCVNFVDNQQLDFLSTIENSKYKFSFDQIFNPRTPQSEIFDTSAKPIVNSILEGFNGTVLAYGQTASGKTYTMQGNLDFPEQEGIIPRTISLLFESITNSPEEIEFTVKTSMVEIYMEKIRDLIDPSRMNLNIREDKNKGIYIEDISEYYVGCKEEILELIRLGSENRAIASTNMNENSSRSHSIFIITVHQLNSKDGSAKNSKLVLVDLAGSEKISKTGATGLTLEEAKTINKSLTTLGMVINSLTDGKSSHIPYRESKLTRVLQESLGGNSKTCLIITCSPSIYNESESLSTLRFGNRAKNIRNKPKINKETTLAEMQLVIDDLEKKLTWAMDRIGQLEKFISSHGLQVPKDKINTERLSLEKKDTTLRESKDNERESKNHNFGMFSEFRIEKVNDDEYETGKIQKDQSKNAELNTKKDSLTNKDLVISNQVKEERPTNSDKDNIILELNKIILDNESFITKLKENEKLLQTKNETLNDQIQQIQTKGFLSEKESIDILLSAKENNTYTTQNLTSNSNNTQIIYNINNTTNQDMLNNSNNNTTNFILNPLATPKLEKHDKQPINDKVNGDNKDREKEIKELSKFVTEVDELKRELKKSENEKKFILKAIEEKSEKIAQQEIENKEFHDMVKILESKISPEDRNFAKKIIGLEKNLEQMNNMYQQIVTQKGVVKCENQILNKKIKQRNDRIMMMEKEIAELKDCLKQKDEKLNNIQRSTIKANNVVKVIKGGHNKQNTLFSSIQISN